jgi:hypothetical protein
MNKTQIRQDATCAACQYYQEQDNTMGSCHRYPPSFAGEHIPRELHRWCFPLTSAHAWCGEHRPGAPERSGNGI